MIEFTLPLQNDDYSPLVRFRVWLIYADFMGAPTPKAWPEEMEWKGGILAYFYIHWHTDSNGEHHLTLKQATPPFPTHFDWATWIGPHEATESERAVARLRAE